MIIKMIAYVLLISIVCFFFNKYYKKCETILEKTLYMMTILIFVFPVVMYYLDKINIATIFKYSDDINQEVWLELLFNYGALIISQIISAVVLFFITRMQIDEARKESEERAKEEHRINNMPLLKYKFKNAIAFEVYNIETKHRKGTARYLALEICNIGETTVRKCYVNINSNEFKKDYTFKLSEQSCIQSKEEELIAFDMKLKEGEYIINITIYFQDIIHNWYKQDIVVEYITSQIYDSSEIRYPHSIRKCTIRDEVLLKEEPKLEFDN